MSYFFRLFIICLVVVDCIRPCFAQGEKKDHPASWWRSNWLSSSPSNLEIKTELNQIFQILGRSSIGGKLLEIAYKKNPLYREQITIGRNSVTETIFSRSYSLQDGTERVEVESVLHLNQKLSRKDVLLDLSHELMHFLFRNPKDPYRHSPSIVEFIREGIEGRGGELDAFEAECLISWDLEKRENLPPHQLCERYKKPESDKKSLGFDREKARLDYYALGPYYSSMVPFYRSMPELTDKPTVFTSSLEKSPYPVALIQEYFNVQSSACENNRRKEKLIKQQAARLRRYRVPATAEVLSNLENEKQRLEQYEKHHCVKLQK